MTASTAIRSAEAGQRRQLRRLLKMDGAACLASGGVAVAGAAVIGDAVDAMTASVAISGALVLGLGLAALVVAGLAHRWLEKAAMAFVAVREAVLVAVLLLGLSDGVGSADLLVGALVVEAIVLGLVEVRAARRAERPASSVGDREVLAASA